ncbi:MAG: hypothetical protein JOZ56_10165 [Actinobacteria bacterium]|nr:hypothetical protein [Actinomycetota bacterium]MBV8563443.1 hypothetical protein [Actinomycetota bacterium]
MSRRLVKALAAAAAVALVAAGSALAANTGTVGVSVSGTSTTIHVTLPKTSDPPAVLNILVPSGYTGTFGQSAGSAIGSIPSATAYSYDTQLTLPLTGQVLVSTLDQVGSASYTPCLQGATPAAVWILNLSVAGQTLAVPMYVLTGPTGYAYELRTCLPPPDVPTGTPGRAAFGAQLLDAEFTVTGVFSGTSTTPWETLITPYTPTKGTPNLAGTFEARSIVGSGSVTLSAKLNKKTHVAALSGTVGGAGSGTVTIYRGATPIATATASGGSFSAKAKVTGKKPVQFTAKVTGAESQTACSTPLPASVAPAGCASATVGAFTATSAAVTVKP